MKRTHFLIVLVVFALASCSTAKNSQGTGSYSSSGGTASNNGEYYSTPNDQYVHMLVANPARWSYFDDYNYDYYGAFGPSCFSSFGNFMYGYTPWTMGFGYWSPYSYWNSYYTWNTFYNPYYSAVVVYNPKSGGVPSTPAYTKISTFAPSSYSNNLLTTHHPYANARSLPVSGRGYALPSSYGQTIHTGGGYSNFNYGGQSNLRGGYSPSLNSSGGGARIGGGFSGGSGFSSHSMGGGGGRH
jgi:hypothetical protein